MNRLLAETPRDQEMIDRLVEENRKLQEEIERLKKDIEEYKKRHPTTVGIKNGKAYFIMDEHPQKEKSTRNPGAQPGHRGHFRRIPRITERITLKASAFSCPICSSPLIRKGIRKRVIEDIPPIEPIVIQYRIERTTWSSPIPPPARKPCCRASCRRWKPTVRRKPSPASWCQPVTRLTSTVQPCTRASRRSLLPSCMASTCR